MLHIGWCPPPPSTTASYGHKSPAAAAADWFGGAAGRGVNWSMHGRQLCGHAKLLRYTVLALRGPSFSLWHVERDAQQAIPAATWSAYLQVLELAQQFNGGLGAIAITGRHCRQVHVTDEQDVQSSMQQPGRIMGRIMNCCGVAMQLSSGHPLLTSSTKNTSFLPTGGPNLQPSRAGGGGLQRCVQK